MVFFGLCGAPRANADPLFLVPSNSLLDKYGQVSVQVLRQADSTPVTNTSVTFAVAAGQLALSAQKCGKLAASITIQTDAQGTAIAYVKSTAPTSSSGQLTVNATSGPDNTSLTIDANKAPLPRPSILFCSPQGADHGWIDIKCLNQLYADGFEVNYTDSLLDILPKQKAADGTYHPKIDINNYNVVVLYATPEMATLWMGYKPFAADGSDNVAFLQTINAYVDNGGGVFLHPMELNVTKQMLYDIAHPWGVDLPTEMIINSDANKANLEHASYPVPIAYSNNVNHSGVAAELTAGVNAIWYPVAAPGDESLDGAGGPLALSTDWTVLVSAAADSSTAPITFVSYLYPPDQYKLSQPGTAPRDPPISAPPLMAVRGSLGSNGAGRAAMLNQWPQYTIGSGLGWIFNSQVLSAGSGNRPSDMGLLLENTYRWLGRPSIEAGTTGGYLTASSRLQPPNAAPEIKAQFTYNTLWGTLQSQWGAAPTYTSAYKGLIGAQTIYSGGSSTVAAYAQAARAHGVTFVVFLEDLNHLSAVDYASLQQDCLNNSGSDLLLVPGFKVQADTGDHMFFFGPGVPYPSDDGSIIIMDGKKVYNLRQPDAASAIDISGQKTYSSSTIRFTENVGQGHGDLYRYLGDRHESNVGFYNFSDPNATMHIADLPLCGMVALCYYNKNQVVENFTSNSNLAAYRTCAQGTCPPVPVSVNEVSSIDEFNNEVGSDHALTYVRVSSIANLFYEGLGFGEGPWCKTFVSDGPVIHEWQNDSSRAATYGAEEFVTQASLMAQRVEVSSSNALDRLNIYNGQDLFRSISPGATAGVSTNEWWAELMLNSSVQKNLILEVSDSANHRAVSWSKPCWKDGGRAVNFCGDHLNDCRPSGLMGKGSFPTLIMYVPLLSNDAAGYTWDGGPTANAPLLSMGDGRPSVSSNRSDLTTGGQESTGQFHQTPLLEFSDEGAAAVTSENNRLFDARVENPSGVWGPLGGSPKLLTANLRYREYLPPTVGPVGTNWAAYSERGGIACSVYRGEIEFKQAMTVSDVWITSGRNNPAPSGTNFAYGHMVDGHPIIDGVVQLPRDFGSGGANLYSLNPGDWFALFSADDFENHVFVVRSEPVKVLLALLDATQQKRLFLVVYGSLASPSVVAGEKHAWELFSLGVPIDCAVHDVKGITNMLSYLGAPDGLVISHGSRTLSPGLLEIAPADGYVDVSVTQPAANNNLTLPLRVSSLNRRWTVGLLQKAGYVLGNYGTGFDRYRETGLDADGYAYVPLYPNRAPQTHVIVGHPVTASGADADQLFIQVTHLNDCPAKWHVSVNNPTDHIVTATLHNAFALPGMSFPDTNVTLQPGEYRELPVTCSGPAGYVVPGILTSVADNAFSNCRGLASVSIPASITSIGNRAFAGCSDLTSVTIENGPSSIGQYAFQNCSNLTSINIPASVTSIGNGAFAGCGRLAQINVDVANPKYASVDGVLFDKSFTQLIQYPMSKTDSAYSVPASVTSLATSAFYGCSNLTSVTIPGAVASIGNYSFAGCSALKSVNIAYGVTSIGIAAFSGCSNLTGLTIPSSVSTIGNSAFYRCANLTSITIPASVTSLGIGAFSYCNNLTTVNIANGFTSIGQSLFYGCSKLENITIPASVTLIGSQAFYGCTSLIQVSVDGANAKYASLDGVLYDKLLSQLILYPPGKPQAAYSVPNGVVTIAANAFSNNQNLHSIDFPNSVTSIGGYAFAGCSGLVNVTLPTGLSDIATGAFSGCAGLVSMTIPNNVKSIGWDAFADCGALANVTIPNGVTDIYQGAFSGCVGLTRITIPASVTDIDYQVFVGCNNLGQFLVDGANPVYCSVDGVLFDKAVSELIQYPAGKLQAAYTIPAGVNYIDDSAFAGSSHLTSIIIPGSVAYIGYQAFYGCTGLTSIAIPGSVTDIADEAFAGCSSLAGAYFAGNAPTDMGASVFDGTGSYFSVYYPEGAAGFTNPWQGYAAAVYTPAAQDNGTDVPVMPAWAVVGSVAALMFTGGYFLRKRRAHW